MVGKNLLFFYSELFNLWQWIYNEAMTTLISCDTVIDYVRGIHLQREDWYEGDLEQRLRRFAHYELRTIELTKDMTEQWLIREDKSLDYQERPFPAPPIVFDELMNEVIDGAHRCHAYWHRGQRAILAYVGVAEPAVS